jgi:capsular exopolysaccharide synthesis family protein
VITAGDPPPNPSELLGSQIMSTILDDLKNMFDIILIDTPPALVVTDAAVLLPNVDGVLLVIKPGMTSITALTRLVNQFRQLNANFLGVVVNDFNLKNSSYGYYYKHYQYKADYSGNNGHKKIKLNFPIFRNSKKMIKENQGNKYP